MSSARLRRFAVSIAVSLFGLLCSLHAQTATQTASIQLSPAAMIIVPATVTLVGGGPAFSAFHGSLNLNFMVRTSPVGSGSLTVQATQFAPTGGPVIAGSNLTYTCSAATVGSACSSSTPTSLTTTTATSVVNAIGASTCTGSGCAGSDPQSVHIDFSLINSPQFSTGTYTSTLTFTISAT